MLYSQNQIKQANETDLAEFLLTQGEELIKSGREYRLKAHDSVTINKNQWFRHSENIGGYPVDFVMKFYGLSFSEAVDLLLNGKGDIDYCDYDDISVEDMLDIQAIIKSLIDDGVLDRDKYYTVGQFYATPLNLVSQMLGHSQISTTLNKYCDAVKKVSVSSEEMQRVANAIEISYAFEDDNHE